VKGARREKVASAPWGTAGRARPASDARIPPRATSADGDGAVEGGAVRRERGKSPPRVASGFSVARLQRSCCVTWQCGMDGCQCRPSQEPAVHRPSFPAAAITPCRRVVAFGARRSDSLVRSDVRESEFDESRKMIRALVTLSARAYCVSTKSVRTRAQIARRRHRGADCVARVSRSRRVGVVQHVIAMHLHLPPRSACARGGRRVVSPAAAAARRGAARRRCRPTADGSAGCRPPVPAHARPSR
jgi:hypothetical protein